jgi:formylglycine-generating enzyme required for sulfatase activity
LKVRAGKLDIPIVDSAEERAEKEQEEREWQEREEKTQQEIEFRRKTEFELRNANQLLQFQIERIEQLAREKKEAEEHAHIASEQSAEKGPEGWVVQDAEKNKIEDGKWSDRLTIGDMEFIHIPKGKFTMGDESEKHKIDIPYDYFMARFPVTNRQFKEFVDSSNFNESWGVEDWSKKLDHPVVMVSWYVSQEYCQWSSQVNRADLPDNYIFRLPTEAEWEKAARGVEGWIWPWGNKFDKSKCNSRENGITSTTSVGSYSPQGNSSYGLSDMAGNVSEWTNSAFQSYPYRNDDGRESGVAKGYVPVLRGGSFDSYSRDATYRFAANPNYGNISYGFRVVLAPKLK